MSQAELPGERAGLTPDAARALTMRIRTGLEDVYAAIEAAWTGRAAEALGYPDWNTYVSTEFSSLRIPRGQRSAIISSLHHKGMSTRAIAAATGVSRETVRREFSGDTFVSPENRGKTGDAFASPATVTGTDGKTYPARRPTPPPSPVAPQYDHVATTDQAQIRDAEPAQAERCDADREHNRSEGLRLDAAIQAALKEPYARIPKELDDYYDWSRKNEVRVSGRIAHELAMSFVWEFEDSLNRALALGALGRPGIAKDILGRIRDAAAEAENAEYHDDFD